MALKDYTTGVSNRILIGGASAVGLIITAIVGVSVYTPAYQVRDSGGQVTWQVNLKGDSTQSGVLAAKSLLNCNTIDTTSTGMLICGSDATGAGSGFGTGNVVTIGDSKYVNVGGDTMTGALNVRAALSGSSLFTLSGYRTCTIKTTSTGMTICGTDIDTQWSSTGSILTATDSKYVNVGGDTMTGALTINVTGGSQQSIGLKVLNTVSGASIHAESILTSSGTFITEGEARMNSGATINGRVTFVGYSSTPQLTAADPDTGIHFDGPGIVSFHNGGTQTMLLSSTNKVGIGAGSPKTKLEVVGAISGATLYTSSGLSTSGSLTVKGTTSGSAIRGFGLLTDCDTAGTSKLLWDSTLGRFSCGTDTDTTYTAGQGLTLNGTSFRLNAAITGSSLKVTGTVSGALAVFSNYHTCTLKTSSTGNIICGTDLTSTATFGTGNVVSIGDAKYVNIGGDTMTGALSIDLTTGFRGLLVKQTISGSIIHAERGLTSSGAVVWESTASGASIWVSRFDGAGLTDCDLTTNKVLWDTTLDRFSCGTDLNTGSVSTGALLGAADRKYVNLGGDTMTGALTIDLTTGFTGLNIKQTTSGSIIHAERGLTSSGAVTFETSASGGILYISRNSTFSSDQITFSSSGSTVFNAGSQSVDFRINGSTAGLFYLDASTNRIGINKTDPTTTLDVNGTISGSYVTATEISPRWFQAQIVASGSSLSTGSGSGGFHFQIPLSMSGWNVFSPQCSVDKAGVTNTSGFQFRDREKKRKILSTNCTIDSTESGSITAAAPCVVDLTADDVGGGDHIYVDTTNTSTTAPKGLNCMFGLRKP